MKLVNFLFLAPVLSLLFTCCGDLSPSAYDVVPPSAPEEWVSLLGEPFWRIEWLDKSGNRRLADIPPGKSLKIEIPVTWANPVTAWPYWPDYNLPPGVFKPAGALFPFDADGGRLNLSWKAGVDTVFYWELAFAGGGQNGSKIPANFDWPRFRELFTDESTNEAVRKDPWLADWRSIAQKTISANFDRRRLVPEASEPLAFPVDHVVWYGTSPFGESLDFNEGEEPVFPVRPGLNVWVSSSGILRCTGKTWTLRLLSTKPSIGYYGYYYYKGGTVLAKICLCLTAKTIQRNLEILNKYRKYTDIAELRVDCLNPDDRLHIRRFPELAGLPVILTIRRDSDGGFFSGGEGARVRLMARGLAFAEADRRKNFAYVDIEEDLEVPSLEEAARTFGSKIIRSYHNMEGIIDDIPAKINSMKRTGDETVKMALKANSTSDVVRVYNAAKESSVQDKIILCMGHLGFYTRILSEKFGSIMTYSSALSETESPGAAWQLDIKELNELYRYRNITKKTKLYGITGFPLRASISTWVFNIAFGIENTDAVYVQFPADSVSDIIELAEELGVHGLSVTVPYKEDVLPALTRRSAVVHSIGACNFMSRSADGWFGDNTDCTSFSASILAFLGKKNLKWKKITIIGAGGVARAVAAEVFRMGGKALILNRTIHKAKDIASLYNFRWGGLDEHGIELIEKYQDIIIQATSVGMGGYEASDPLELYTFTGKEIVMDLVYYPAQTPFLTRAAAAGCRTINGYDMVTYQVCHQYKQIMGREISPQLLSRVIKIVGASSWNKIRTE